MADDYPRMRPDSARQLDLLLEKRKKQIYSVAEKLLFSLPAEKILETQVAKCGSKLSSRSRTKRCSFKNIVCALFQTATIPSGLTWTGTHYLSIGIYIKVLIKLICNELDHALWYLEWRIGDGVYDYQAPVPPEILLVSLGSIANGFETMVPEPVLKMHLYKKNIKDRHRRRRRRRASGRNQALRDTCTSTCPHSFCFIYCNRCNKHYWCLLRIPFFHFFHIYECGSLDCIYCITMLLWKKNHPKIKKQDTHRARGRTRSRGYRSLASWPSLRR